MTKIVRLRAQGFKRIVAVDIQPDGNLVRIRGNNEAGKTSVLDAIFAAIGGASAAPIKPVRTGEEYAAIVVDMGPERGKVELEATRYFDAEGDRLVLKNADGATYGAAQTKLDDMVGALTFDPLAFANMGDREQVAELLRLVPLEVDLAQLKAADKADYEARRDVNRDAAQLKARFEAIAVHTDLPEVAPDRAALLAQLTQAAETNAAIERDKLARDNERGFIAGRASEAERKHEEARELIRRAEALQREATDIEHEVARRTQVLEGMDPPAEPVNTADLEKAIAEADAIAVKIAARDERAKLAEQFAALRAISEGYTLTMAKREEDRQAALKAAKMPIDGLSLATFDDELRVTFNGEPFSQSSGAQRIRVSTALAIAANPKLRVCRIKDGSLLDKANLAVLAEMADKHDFQIWLEEVGEEGEGWVIEAGKVKGAPDPEKLDGPKRRKKAGEGDDAGGEAQTKGPAAGPGEVASAGSGKSAAKASPAPAQTSRPKPQAMGEFTTQRPGELDL